VVWEPLHKRWFSNRVDDLLKEFHVARVAADPACGPTVRRPGGVTILAYFRLHGSPRRYYSGYSDDFLDALPTQVTSLTLRERVWCVFDNTASGAANSKRARIDGQAAARSGSVRQSAVPQQPPR
jgi:uncharacterized protein YecE (DUF72 family)